MIIEMTYQVGTRTVSYSGWFRDKKAFQKKIRDLEQLDATYITEESVKKMRVDGTSVDPKLYF